MHVPVFSSQPRIISFDVDALIMRTKPQYTSMWYVLYLWYVCTICKGYIDNYCSIHTWQVHACMCVRACVYKHVHTWHENHLNSTLCSTCITSKSTFLFGFHSTPTYFSPPPPLLPFPLIGPSRGSGSDAMYRDWASKPRRGYQTVPSKLSQVDPAPSSHLPSGLKGWSGYQPPPSQPGYQHPHSQPGYQPPSQSGYYQAPHGYGQTAPGFETVSYGSPLPVAASHPHRSAALVPPAAEVWVCLSLWGLQFEAISTLWQCHWLYCSRKWPLCGVFP